MKVLAIGDIANNIYLMKKFARNVEIDIINFPKKGLEKVTTVTEGIEYFDSLLISKQVEKIKKIKHNYDLCIALPWSGVRIAYLAGMNYILYFVGTDIANPLFQKKIKIIIFLRNIFMKAFEKNESLDKKLSMLDRLVNLIFLKIEKIYVKKFREKIFVYVEK